MRSFLRFSAVAAMAAAPFMTHIGASQAQASRTFVSGYGADTGACGITAPCRSFAYAAPQTASGGEITVLDSAGYGPVTIAQPLTITNPGGVEAGVTATSGVIAVTVTVTSGTVVLRGLTLEGVGVGATGVSMSSTLIGTATLDIIDCVIKDFAGNGIAISTTSTSIRQLIAVVDNTRSLNNVGTGLLVQASNAAQVLLQVYQSTFDGNATGVSLAYGNVTLGYGSLFANSHADANTNGGIDLTNSSASLIMKNSTAINNLGGGSLIVANDATVYLFDSNVIDSFNMAGSCCAAGDGTNDLFDLPGGLTTFTKH